MCLFLNLNIYSTLGPINYSTKDSPDGMNLNEKGLVIGFGDDTCTYSDTKSIKLVRMNNSSDRLVFLPIQFYLIKKKRKSSVSDGFQKKKPLN